MADSRYVVMGQIFITNGTAGVSVTGRQVTDTSFTCTGAGTFTINMASGTTCTVSGTNVQGTPVTLSAGANTITTTGAVTNGQIDITIGTAANWNTVNSFAATSGGACGASIPTSVDDFYADANSFTAGSQVLTVDVAASCLSMNWTGATNTPTLAFGTNYISIVGNLTTIAAMSMTGTGSGGYCFYFQGTNNIDITTNGLVFNVGITTYQASSQLRTIKLLDNLNLGTGSLGHRIGGFNTNDKTVTCNVFSLTTDSFGSFRLGSSIINCSSYSITGIYNGLAHNTATINCTGNFTGSHKTLVMGLGDSLSDNTYEPALLTALGSNYYVIERGVGSNTTTQMLARLNSNVIDTGAAYAVVWGGVNDIAADVSAVDIEANLQTIYTNCHNAGIKVVAVTITPYKGSATWSAARQLVCDDVNAWIANTAIDVDYVIDMWTLLEDPAAADTLLAAYDSGDHIHLSATGYNLVASTLNSLVPFAPAPYYNINLNGTAHTVSGSFTCANLTRTGTATKTDSVTFTSGNTVTVTDTLNLSGNSSTNRLLVQSSTPGSPATLYCDGTVEVNNADFMDITATGTPTGTGENDGVDWDISACTGLSGDCQGNTGITFTSPAAQTWDGTTGSWSDIAKWTSRVPLPQDDVSAGGTGNTITVDMPRIGKSITFTGTPTISLSNTVAYYGSFTLPIGCTYTHNNNSNAFYGRTTYTITSNGKTLYRLQMRGVGGTCTQTDNLALAYSLDLSDGIFNASTFDTTMSFFYSNYSSARGLVQNGGSLTCTTSGDMWYATATMNYTPNASLLILSGSNASARVFRGGSLIYNNVTVQGAGAYALTISGNNTFNTFTVDRSVANKTITGTAGSIQTVTNFVCAVSGTRTLTLNSTGAAWTLVKVGGGTVNMDYVVVSNNIGNPIYTWSYGDNGTDGGGNTNWYNNVYALSIADSFSLLDSISESMTCGTSISDTFGLQDSFLEIMTAYYSISDTLEFNDSEFITANLSINDYFSLIDVMAEAMAAGCSISDTFEIDDNIDVAIRVIRKTLSIKLSDRSVPLRG